MYWGVLEIISSANLLLQFSTSQGYLPKGLLSGQLDPRIKKITMITENNNNSHNDNNNDNNNYSDNNIKSKMVLIIMN